MKSPPTHPSMQNRNISWTRAAKASNPSYSDSQGLAAGHHRKHFGCLRFRSHARKYSPPARRDCMFTRRNTFVEPRFEQASTMGHSRGTRVFLWTILWSKHTTVAVYLVVSTKFTIACHGEHPSTISIVVQRRSQHLSAPCYPLLIGTMRAQHSSSMMTR